jgi:hypothetical protein
MPNCGSIPVIHEITGADVVNILPEARGMSVITKNTAQIGRISVRER